MWIKICGTTTMEDAKLAVACGADALGFVFAPSPRRVDEDTARRIIAELPSGVERYGVFVDVEFDRIIAAIESCGLTGVQLHRSAEPGLAGRLKRYCETRGRKLSVIAVLSLREGSPDRTLPGLLENGLLEDAVRQDSADPAVDAVLVDSCTPNAVGGTGARFDWQAAQNAWTRASRRMRLIVAGGLNADNVAEAIGILRPWGVDVASGVESAPGRKDAKRLAAFIETARRAAEGSGEQRAPKTAAVARR